MNGRNQYSTMDRCRNGHPYTDGSVLLIQRKDGTTKRTCKRCNAARNARWYESKVKPTLTGRKQYPCVTEECVGTYNWSRLRLCPRCQAASDFQRHKEARMQTFYRWARNNKDSVNAIQSRRRACGGTMTAAAWQSLIAFFGHLCAYCHQRFIRLEQDHVVPLSKGGMHNTDNVVPACRSCNAAKGAS